MMYSYDNYLNEPNALDFDQKKSLHSELIDEIDTDPDALELYDDLIIEEVKGESEVDSLPEILEKISVIITGEIHAELFEDLLLACRNERERQLIAFRFGLEDGEPKTLQETADKFGISRERAKEIEHRAMRIIRAHIRRRKSLSDFLND